MGQSVRASAEGIVIINQARQRRGWTKTSTARWWQDAHTSRATLRRFWQGERIQQDAFIAICQAVGIEDWTAIAHLSPMSADTHPPAPSPVDWGDAPDIEQFYDRASELAQLRQWAIQDRAKLIHISGLGGIGKTTLAVALAEQLQTEFDRVIWRSGDGPLDRLLTALLDNPIERVEQGIQQLRQTMQQRRWLMILDNIESHWELLESLTRARHQSCVVAVSREPLPAQIGPLNQVQSLFLCGLSVNATIQLLHACGCGGQPHQLNALARLYCYNPLALKLVASTIQTVFGGAIAPFLEQETVILPEPILLLLSQQFESLNPLEKTLMFWLAIWQEPIAFCRLQTHLLHSNPAAVIEALSALVGRSLITRHFLADEPSFSLQPMIMTFATKQLVDAVLKEIRQAQQQQSIEPLQLLRRHCLIRPGTDDIWGDRILTTLRETYPEKGWRSLLPIMEKWSALAQNEPPNTRGYLTFNLTALKIIQGSL